MGEGERCGMGWLAYWASLDSGISGCIFGGFGGGVSLLLCGGWFAQVCAAE